MPGDKSPARVAAEWVVKADNDLKNATHTLKLGQACPADTVCFHAQQCAEKYLKAYLVFLRLDFPKTHEIEKLISLLPAGARPKLRVEEQARLTEYAVTPRYPGWREVTLAEARRAVPLARRVRKHVRSLLPKDALRPRQR